MKANRAPAEIAAAHKARLHVRVAAEQLARWQAAAAADGRTLTNWVTRQLDHALGVGT